MNIIKILKQYTELICFFIKKYGNDPEEIKKRIITDVDNYRNLMPINIMEMGQLNKDKIIALVELPDRGLTPITGFFGLFHKIVQIIAYCDRYNFVPVVDKWFDSVFEEKEFVNGTDNVFEYYFKQPSGISLEEARKSANVVIPKVKHMWYLSKYYQETHWYTYKEDYLNHLAYIYKKYIHLNDITEKKIYADIENILGRKKTLAIHVRGTDFKLNCDNHPVLVTPDEYIPVINAVMIEYNFEQIFLATDDAAVTKLFKKEFKDAVVYYNDVARVDGNVSVAFSESERKNHHYLCGLEVLRDMYTMAACDGLIAGMSQVNMYSRIVRKSWGKEYEYLNILSKGINYNNVIWADISKKQKRVQV